MLVLSQSFFVVLFQREERKKTQNKITACNTIIVITFVITNGISMVHFFPHFLVLFSHIAFSWTMYLHVELTYAFGMNSHSAITVCRLPLFHKLSLPIDCKSVCEKLENLMECKIRCRTKTIHVLGIIYTDDTYWHANIFFTFRVLNQIYNIDIHIGM